MSDTPCFVELCAVTGSLFFCSPPFIWQDSVSCAEQILKYLIPAKPAPSLYICSRCRLVPNKPSQEF